MFYSLVLLFEIDFGSLALPVWSSPHSSLQAHSFVIPSV